MKAHVDLDLCIGCGICPDVAPQIFEMGSDDKAHVKVDPVPEELHAICRDAWAIKCPQARSIEIEEASLLLAFRSAKVASFRGGLGGTYKNLSLRSKALPQIKRGPISNIGVAGASCNWGFRRSLRKTSSYEKHIKNCWSWFTCWSTWTVGVFWPPVSSSFHPFCPLLCGLACSLVYNSLRHVLQWPISLLCAPLHSIVVMLVCDVLLLTEALFLFSALACNGQSAFLIARRVLMYFFGQRLRDFH